MSAETVNPPSPPSCFVDDKYENVTMHLQSSGWTRVPAQEPSVGLIWTNLSKLDFSSIPSSTLVNHFKGAHHWSNKAYFSYHMTAAGCQSSMPIHWSPCHNNVFELVSLLVCESIYSLAKCILLGDFNPAKAEELNALNAIAKLLDEQLPGWNSNNKFKNLFRRIISANAVPVASRTGELKDVAELVSEIDSNEPWRMRWGGDQSVWIVKPVGQSCGQGITVLTGLKSIFDTINSFACKCILQKYIERPLLVEGRKFDIRQWVLVTSVDPLEVFGFSECYLRLSTKEYSLEELANPLVHLCNHSIQKTGENFEQHQSMISQDDFSKNYLINHPKINKTAGDPFKSHLLPMIQKAAIEAVSAVRDKLSVVGRGFEWLGMDFMVSDSLEVFLIEVNTSPDISSSTPLTTRLVQEAVPKLFNILENRCYNHEVAAGDESPQWEIWYSNATKDSSSETKVESIDSLQRRKRNYGPMYSSGSVPGGEFVHMLSSALAPNAGSLEEEEDEDEM